MSVPIQSVQRAMRLLDFLADHRFAGRPAALREAAAHLGLGATTTHNLLKTLVCCGYARKVGEGRYDVGPAAEDLHRAAVAPRSLMTHGQGALHSLAGRFHESVVLAALFRGRRHILARVSGDQQLAVDPTDADDGDIWSRVTGRVLAAFTDEAGRDQILALNGLPTAWDGVRSAGQLDRALADIRKAGWAEECADNGHIWSVAVPALDRRRHLLASIGMFMPAVRATRQRMAEIRSAMAGVAGALGRKGIDVGQGGDSGE